jgi:tetratricopeptide (TPR) repeat protein
LDVERHEAAAASARAGLEALSKVATSDAESAAGPLHRGLALAELRLGRLEAARAALGDDDDPGVRAELALAEGDLVVADARAREAVQAATGRWRADHPYVTESSELLARVLVAAERNADAIAILEPAIAILERSCGPEHPQLIGPLETLAHAVAGEARAAELRARASRLRAAMLA